MASFVTFTCDGCDERTTKLDGETGMPRGWGRVSITASGFRGWTAVKPADVNRQCDLCEACQNRLADSLNPKQWARAEKAA